MKNREKSRGAAQRMIENTSAQVGGVRDRALAHARALPDSDVGVPGDPALHGEFLTVILALI
jgi:hypothetical protein